MKLNIVPAQQGALWARLGIRTFWRQPLAFTGLFFIFMTVMSVCSLIPVLGSFIALALIPAATLGLMAATREVELGKFPMPTVLAVAFRAGNARKRDMLILGVLYAFGLIGVMMLTALVDGGAFARIYLLGGTLDTDTLMRPEFQNAVWLSLLFYMPLSAIFWYAPALVHWHGVPAVKSLFFSAVACWRNWRAFLVYGLMWTFIFAGTVLGISLLSALTESDFASMALLPASLMLAAMFFCSIYFSFRDSFVADTHYA
jgi:hypothetical protein